MAASERLAGRARAAILSLWCVAIADAAAVAAGVAYTAYLRSLDSHSIVADLDLDRSELAYSLAGLAQGIALIATAVLFIRWFHLAHSSLGAFSDEPRDHDSRWAIWGFFVPILNLVRPYHVMREIWTVANRKWKDEPSWVVGLQPPSDRVTLWWTLFLTTSFLGNGVARAAWRADTAQETLWATSATIFADAFDILAVVAAVALVRSITGIQSPLLDRAPVTAPTAGMPSR